MKHMKPDPVFALGRHRPVYLWAGQSTVRMNRLKFMNAPVDEFVHEEAHQPIGAQRLAKEAGCNWAYLMYDWGFPPEIEQADWDDFERAVQIYHAAGVKVFGYVQTSNCVYQGSYKTKDWYALDPQGRHFHYYTGRYMTCWQHPEWLDHLRAMIQGIVEAGAEGVFFDNPWYGTDPMHFLGAWMGSAGCYCPRCRIAYREASGAEIPRMVAPGRDGASQGYLRWRAGQVSSTLAELSDYARSLNPQIYISANDYDVIMRPSYLVYGVDLGALARIQDVVMIEDFALPRWEGDLLVNNALTLRTARALIGETPLSTIPYDQGIGFDAVYPPRRFAQAIAEAAACGAAAVIKGTEFFDAGAFTLLTAEIFAPQREAAGQINQWLAEHATLFEKRVNAATIGLLHPGENLFWHWDKLAPLYFGTAQTLLVAGIPWRVVTTADDCAGLKVLLTFGEAPVSSGMRVVPVPNLPGWEPRPIGFFDRHPKLHALAARLVDRLYRAYFENRWFRALGDFFGITSLYMASPLFNLPALPARQTLLAALGERSYPQVASDAPVLVEYWKRQDENQLHLVNYAAEPAKVRVDFGSTVSGSVQFPDGVRTYFEGEQIEIDLDVYSLLIWK
jgi:hypothetical protein